MIQSSEANEELEIERERENWKYPLPRISGEWVFPVFDLQRHDLIQNGPNQDLEKSDESYLKDAKDIFPNFILLEN